MTGNQSKSADHKELSPLANHLVLENLFKFCSLQDLSECRLVCKLWHYISLPFWSERLGEIRLYEQARDAVFEKNKHMNLSSFMETYKMSAGSNPQDLSIAGWPYRNFKLMFFRNLTYNSSNQFMKQFWLDCGPWITDLQIFGARLNDYQTYRDVLLCKYTPNVKIFKFSCQLEGPIPFNGLSSNESISDFKDAHTNLQSLTISYCIPKVRSIELFSNFPNMTKLEVYSPYRLTNWENKMESMLESIHLVRKNNPFALQLKSLDIHVDETQPNAQVINHHPVRILDLLMRAKLPLQSLRLDAHLFKGSGNVGHLESLLLIYKDSLKKLKFRDCLSQDPLIFPSIVMSSLEELILVGKTFKDMSFLKFTPNLKLFHVINQWRSHALDRYLFRGFIKSDQPLKLRSIRDFRYDFDCTVCSLMKLVTWMPRVEVLQIPLTNETFRDVCTFWIDLKHLVVLKDYLDDNGICGALRADQLVTGTLKFKEHGLNHWPSIRDLKELRSFTMENNRCTNNEEVEELNVSNDILPTRLTEKSFIHGFLKLPSLHKLNITVEENTVSDQLLETLKKKIPDVNVVQMTHPYRHRPL